MNLFFEGCGDMDGRGCILDWNDDLMLKDDGGGRGFFSASRENIVIEYGVRFCFDSGKGK